MDDGNLATSPQSARVRVRWDSERFVPLSYPVSETRPIQVAANEHALPRAESFDMHYALELGIVTQGRMQRLYHEHERSLGPGQVWLCGAWEPHGWRVESGACEAVVVSIFPPTLANATLPELASHQWHAPFVERPQQRPQVAEERRVHVRQLARQLALTADLAEPQRLLLQRMLVYQVLLELPRVVRKPGAAPLPRDAWECVNRAMALVMSRKTYITASEAARECALSQKALNSLFGRAVGLSFAKFALRYRLQGAASRLLESCDPVKAIAQDWGFVDSSHFHACFSANYGCSPARYRERGGQLT